MNNQEIVAKLKDAGFYFYHEDITNVLNRFEALGVKYRYDEDIRYDWGDSYEGESIYTNQEGQECTETWTGDQYYINNGLVALSEEDYYKATGICDMDKDDAESLLARWKQFHDADTEGYPIFVFVSYRADIENEDGEEDTVEDPQCTIDGTGRFSLIV